MSNQPSAVATAYQDLRRELVSYVTRMVVRPEIAEELVQQAALKLVETDNPPDAEGARAWLFRVATNLAIDYLRRHSTWREDILVDTRNRAKHDEAFVAQSKQLVGSPEMASIAREHLAVCLTCTMRNLPPEQASALLLVEVFGFSFEEAAKILDGSFGQVKNWIQAARHRMRRKYEDTCALINKNGVCHQCVELSSFFNGRKEDPLKGTAKDIDARLAILREQRQSALGSWHQLMMRLVDDLLEK